MGTPTTNYGLIMPAVNDPTDQDLWGGELNGDIDEIDGLLLTAINFISSSETAAFSVAAPAVGTSAVGDSNKLFQCDATAGNIVASLPAAASAGNGFKVGFKKIDSGTNAVTITANAAETIDGSNTLVLSAQYAYAILQCDGVKWSIIGQSSTAIAVRSIKAQTFTSSETYTPSAGLLYAEVEMVGGGGGGGGVSSSTNYGGSGSAAGYLKASLTAAQISTSQAVTIGLGGTPGTNTGSNGGTGGVTSLGSLLSCTGGVGGAGSQSAGQTSGGAGGVPTVTTGTTIIAISGQVAGMAVYNNSVGVYVGGGGSNPLGFGAPLALDQMAEAVQGLAATGYGSGGGGAIDITVGSGQAGGAGQPGYMIITEYCSQ